MSNPWFRFFQVSLFTLLALLNDFRKFDWAEEYKYPTVILAQMNQLLAECQDDQLVVTP